MSRRCGLGLHSWRFVKMKQGNDPLGRLPNWWLLLRCKRCRLECWENRTRYPRLIRTHEWDEA